MPERALVGADLAATLFAQQALGPSALLGADLAATPFAGFTLSLSDISDS